MATLYTMVGLPASGKSTYTSTLNKDTTKVVSTDAIRAELYGDEAIQGNGAVVFAEAHKRVAQYLAEGYDVVLDATHVGRKDRRRALTHKADKHVAVYVGTDAEECKRRNALRERVVPAEVIDRMAQRLTMPTIEEGFDEIVIIKQSQDYLFFVKKVLTNNRRRGIMDTGRLSRIGRCGRRQEGATLHH